MGLCDHVKGLISDGYCDHLRASDVETWMKLGDITEYVSGYQASRILGVSPSRFNDLRLAGLLPEPVKIKGISRLVYSKSKLEEARDAIKKMPEFEVRLKILSAKARMKREKTEELKGKLHIAEC